MPPRNVLVAALATALLAASCTPTPFACAASGGVLGVETQLRFVDANDGQVVFTFGPSPVSNAFGVPTYPVERVDGASGLPALRVVFQGTSVRYPDGSTSYDGPLLIGVSGRNVLEVELAKDVDRAMTWTVTPQGGCPRVAAKTYVYGKSPRAQVALTFGGMSAFTLETTSDFIGTPQDTPVQASGIGFAPNAMIVITAGGAKLWDTTSDADGAFDSGFNIGYPAPGVYSVSASDARGHRGVTRLTVILPTNPFRRP